MMILAATLGLRSSYFPDDAVVLGTTGAGCTLAAFGLYFAKDDEPVPSTRWIMSILLVIVVQWVASSIRNAVYPLFALEEGLPSIAFLIPFAVGAFVLSRARPRHFQCASRRWLALVPFGAMLAGALLILLTLALTMSEKTPGWKIVAQGARWITYEFGLARLLPEAYTSWVRVLLAEGGWTVYLLALIESVIAVCWIVNSRASIQRLSRSRWIVWLGVASCFTTFCVYNGVFWAWQTFRFSWGLQTLPDSHYAIWPDLVAPVLELAAVAGVLLIVIAAARQKETWRGLSLVQVAQLPLAGFNFLMMPAYFGEAYLPGLALLMMGSQLLTWGCLGVLLLVEKETAFDRVSRNQTTNMAASV
jgi:hypothetical protein